MFLDAHGKLATPPGAPENHPDLRHCAIRDSVVLFNDERAHRQTVLRRPASARARRTDLQLVHSSASWAWSADAPETPKAADRRDVRPAARLGGGPGIRTPQGLNETWGRSGFLPPPAVTRDAAA
jgi:hypothetical protein